MTGSGEQTFDEPEPGLPTQGTRRIDRVGGFVLACDDFWEKVGSFIPRLRFFFFFKLEIS